MPEKLNSYIQIPPDEIRENFARSSGAGGQNVNKTSTKVVLHWLIGNSRVLSEDEKKRVREKLANRINSNDEVVLASEEERSQLQNRASVVSRLETIVSQALVVPKKRRPTRPTRGSKLRRLESKKMHSQVKAGRKSFL